MARKFLYFIAFCIVVALIGRIGWEMFKEDLAAIALVPSAEFTPTEALEENAYQDPALWYSRPGIGESNPARWQPAYAWLSPSPSWAATQRRPQVAWYHSPSFEAETFSHPAR